MALERGFALYELALDGFGRKSGFALYFMGFAGRFFQWSCLFVLRGFFVSLLSMGGNSLTLVLGSF
jgi:hypothetical protein